MDSMKFDTLSRTIGKTSSRRRVVKMLGSGVAAAVAAGLGLRARSSEAMPRSSNPQHDFVAECKSNGGESSRVRSRSVKCTYACEYYTVCDFSTLPPVCYDVILQC